MAAGWTPVSHDLDELGRQQAGLAALGALPVEIATTADGRVAAFRCVPANRAGGDVPAGPDRHQGAVLRFAYRRIRSFRREYGGLYALYVSVYSAAYRRRMMARHREGGHGRLMANGRCEWCGAAARTVAVPEILTGAEVADAIRRDTETGLDRVREAVRKARGADPPAQVRGYA
jgi:hypothetical protein